MIDPRHRLDMSRRLDGLPAFALLRRVCLAALVLCAPHLHGQLSMPLHVGPVYTNATGVSGGDGSVDFPKMKVLVTSPVSHRELPEPADLTLLEDGTEGSKAIAVEPFGSTGFGVAAIVAVDVSGSMAGGPLNIIRNSLYKFTSDARPQDAVAVMTIADDAAWEVPFGADRATLQQRLQNMHNRGRLTRLWDGLASALDAFDPKLPARRELTVITDGHDEGSQVKLDDVIRLAQQRNIAIDAIGLTRSEPRYLNDLSLLAQQTGGTFHQVHSDQELQALIGNGMEALKASPVATFQADGIKPDGKQHTLGIVWAGASEHRGETTFTAPEQAAVASSDAAKPRAIWPLVLVAILCVAIVAGAVVFVKRKAGQAELESRGSSSYSLGLSERGPMDSDDPPPAPRASFAEEPDRKPVGGSFDSEPLTPLVSPPAALPEIPVARAEIPRPRNTNQLKTQIVGIFQPLGNRIAALETIAGAHAGEIFDLPVFEFSIGRSPENHLPLGEDKTVSGRHASILFEDPILMVIDHGSTNGTRVNGEMLRGARRPLHEGDQIQIGQTVFRVRSARWGAGSTWTQP